MGNCETGGISVEDQRDILHILIDKNEEIKQLRFQNERLKSELDQVVPLGLRIRIPQQPAKSPRQDSSTQTE